MCIRDRRNAPYVGRAGCWDGPRRIGDGRTNARPGAIALWASAGGSKRAGRDPVSYTHLRAHETSAHL
eukprot:886823-Alexandrium_andersonii.AAC.1